MKNNAKKYLYGAFLAVEIVIYAIFIASDLAGGGEMIYLKYSGVLLCLAVAAAGIVFYRPDAYLMTAALVFTAISDLFMLVLDKYYEVSLCTFIVVQSLYFARIYLTKGKIPVVSLIVRIAVATAVIATLGFTQKLNLLTGLVSFYIVNLLANGIESFTLLKISKKYLFFVIGLWLFIGCDLCVGLDNFGSVLNVELPALLVRIASFAIWACYLPSQVLIVFSLSDAKYKLVWRKENA